MKTTLFLRTEKGVSVLKALINRDLASTVDFFVTGKDPGVQKDGKSIFPGKKFRIELQPGPDHTD